MNTLWTFGIFLALCLTVQAQDRSRSRYISPAADDESIEDDEEFKTTRTSRRIQSPAQRSRPTREPLNVDIDRGHRAPIEDRLPTADDRRAIIRTSSHRQQVSSPSYPSDPRPQYEERIREELPEAPATPPPNRQQEKKKRPKKRRRPKPEIISEEPQNIHNPAEADAGKLPEPLNLDSDGEYTSFRNSNSPQQVENVPSLPHNSPPLDTRSRLPNTRSRGSPIAVTRNREPSVETTRSRGTPIETTRSRDSPIETTRSRSPSLENTRGRSPSLENTRANSPLSEITRGRTRSSENTRSRNPSLDSSRSRSPPLENDRTQNSDSGNSDSRSSRRHSFRPQPAHNRLPIPDNDATSNLGAQDDRNKNAQVIPESDFSSEHINSNSQTSQYNRNYEPLNSPVDSHPYQPTNNDRLPSPERHPEHVSEIHLPPPGQPFDVSEFAQPGVNYRPDLSEEVEPKHPLSPTNHDDGRQDAKFPIPTNRLTNPSDVIYKPPENTEHTFLHPNNDPQSEIRNHQLPPDAPTRAVSDRLPAVNQRHSQQQQNSPEQKHRGQTNPRYSAAVQSRVGSSYQPENQDSVGLHRNENPNRSGPDPKLQNVASRYLQSHRNTNDRSALEEQAPPSRVISEIPLQRAGSRYQPDSLDVEDYNPSRSPQHALEDSVPEVKPGRQRTIPRSQRTRPRYQPEPVPDPAPTPEEQAPRRVPEQRPQRTRSRYQPEPVSDPTPEEEEPRRVPGQRIQRTRSRYQPENDIQPQAPPQRDLRTQNEQVEAPRTVPRRDRTRSRHQAASQRQPNPGNEVPPETNPPVYHRSRPQFEGHSQRNPAAEETQPEYEPDYQNVQRAPPQRRPAPQSAIQQPQAAPKPRQTGRHPLSATRPANIEPVGPSNFRCPDLYGFYPDEQQCDKYYECRNGTAEEGLCSDGLVFNLISSPTYLRCDSFRDVDCSARPNLQEPRSTKNCPRRFGLFPHLTDCTKFWQCVDGSGTGIKCPPGLVYDDEKGTCNWADLVKDSCATEDLLGFTCPEGSPDQLLDGVYIRYAHPENCQLHYTCIKGSDGGRRPRLLSCNEGLVYDPETSQCSRPENVPGCEEYYGKPVARAPARQQPREPPPEEEEPPRTNSRRRRPNQRTRA